MAEQPSTAVPSAQKQNEVPTYGTGVWVSYKIDFRTRLRSSFHSVARFLRIMPRPSHDLFEEFKGLKEEKTGFSDVVAYYYFLSNLYKSASTCSIDRNRWKVTRISTYKATKGFEHESLVADIKCEGETVFLRIERRRSKSKASKANAKAQTSDDSDPSPDSPADTTRPPPTSSLSKKAHDAITFSNVLGNLVKGHEECVDVIQFPEGQELSLPQIAVLARCVNNRGRIYYLFEENCYWFAHVMVETAKLIEPGAKAETQSKRKRGSWKNLLPTVKPTREVIHESKDEYEKLWREFNDDIYNSVNNENSEIYQNKRKEAERLAAEKEEERKAKEEEIRRREEAERLGEGERRKREEAEEEIKKLRAQLAAAQAGANSSSS